MPVSNKEEIFRELKPSKDEGLGDFQPKTGAAGFSQKT